MARPDPETAPAVGLVHDEALAPGAGRKALASARKALEGAGLPVAFEASLDALEPGAGDAAGIAIVVASIEGSLGEWLRHLRDALPEARIVLCSDPAEPQIVRRALDLGIDGLVWSDGLERSLVPAIRAVHAGSVVVPREAFAKPADPELTNREKQTLSMVVMGLTNAEIAEKLFISESTVKSHLNTAYRKLGVHSRSEAQRLITDPEHGLGTGILAITAPGLTRGRPPRRAEDSR